MKKELGKKNCLYPMPTTLVGATVDGKPTFATIAHVGIIGMELVSVSMNKKRYTSIGIREHKTFSVNVPSVSMAEETDYCGLVSGRTVDKSSLFTVFYGLLRTAPMIAACPVNMECSVVQTLLFPTHEVFIGQIERSYAEDSVLTEGQPDYRKINPLLFTRQDEGYWGLGNRVATAWDIGKTYKKK